MKKIILSKQQLEFINKQFNSGVSIRELEKILNIRRQIISRELKQYLNKEEVFTNRKYSLNENYFEIIDSEEKAYWLGFIAADGCIYKTGSNSKVLSFNLNIKDKKHLQKFLKSINSDAIIHIKEGSGYGIKTKIASLQINSKKIVEDLNKLGILFNKSLLLTPPKIKEEYYSSWIRGYFDGDGSVTVKLPNGNSQINFIGTKEILNFIQKFLRPEKINKLQQKNKEKNNFSLTYGGRKMILYLLDKFYKNPTIYLERKYQKVLEVYSRFEEQSSK